MADKLDEIELKGLVSSEIRSAITFDTSELSAKRARALEYYQGDMKDTPAMAGRSSVVSHDVADTIGWMLPGVIRVFTASDEFGVFEPTRPNDEEAAKQATDYCNYVFWKDNHGYRILYNATHDSLLHGNGIGKIWWDDAEECEYSEHTRLTEEQIAILTESEGVEILGYEENEEPDTIQQMDQEAGQPVEVQVPTFDIKIKRINSRGRIRIDTLAPEDFLIDKDAITMEDARFLAHRDAKTRSELIEMGFDKALVEGLPSDGLNDFSEETIARDDDRVAFQSEGDESQELVELFECYVKADADGDGVSETVRVYYAGNAGGGEILDWEICDDDHPFFDLPCEPVPHRWDARSIADETMDVQRIKTVLIRQTLDNLYASNLPLPDVEESSIKNMDALTNPQFGQPIIRKKGAPPINWQAVPFVADKSLEAVRFFDEVIEKRTGVSRSTMALDPEALQNQTATAVQKGQDAAYSQIELVARNHAELGWRVMFKKMLRLIVKHQDRPRIIRLRDKWVDIDPRYWNANMDVTINVGLGTGSRDRDMAMLQQVLATQQGLVDYFMQGGLQAEAMQMLPKIISTMRKIAESAGIKSVESFYPDITEESVQQKLEQMAQQPPQPEPEVVKAQLKAEVDREQAQAKFQLEGQKMQAEQQRDVHKSQIDAELRRSEMAMEAELKREQLQAELQLKREQLAAELQLKRELAMEEMQIKREMGFVNAEAKVASSSVQMGGEPG